jgi:hypothetical protein
MPHKRTRIDFALESVGITGAGQVGFWEDFDRVVPAALAVESPAHEGESALTEFGSDRVLVDLTGMGEALHEERIAVDSLELFLY